VRNHAARERHSVDIPFPPPCPCPVAPVQKRIGAGPGPRLSCPKSAHACSALGTGARSREADRGECVKKEKNDTLLRFPRPQCDAYDVLRVPSADGLRTQSKMTAPHATESAPKAPWTQKLRMLFLCGG